MSFLLWLSLACAQASQLLPGQQTKAAPRPAADRPELMSCAQVLAMSSTDYIAKTVAVNDSVEDGQQRGIRKYGACFDARTDAVARALTRSGRGPTKAARSDFASFEAAIKDFANNALAYASLLNPQGNGSFTPLQPAAPRAAYADLYEKQFRYEFYQEYATKTARSAQAMPKPSGGTRGAKSPAGAAASPGALTGAGETATAEQTRSDADPMTQAKNRFGEILDALPDDRMHELHKAFGEVIEPYSISGSMRLMVYRYAIFLLEPPASKPFAPPPF